MQSIMNSFREPARRFGLAVLATACIGMPSALAQDEALPSGEEVLKKNIEVMGGEEAFGKIKTRVITGTIEMAAMKMKGTMKTYQKRPDNNYIEVEIPNMMKWQEGYADGVAWENNSMMGPRILEGAEHALRSFAARFDDASLDDVFSSIECTGVEDVQGEPCYVLVMVAEGVSPITSYFSKETYLNVKTNMTIDSQFGKMEIDVFISDYKEVDGLLYPHRSVQNMMGQEIIAIVETIEHNVTIEEGRFDLPDNVKALLSAEESDTQESGQEDAP